MAMVTTALLTEDGDVRVFGRSDYNVLAVPEFNAPVVSFTTQYDGGFVAILEDGTAQSWGRNNCTSRDELLWQHGLF